MVKQSIL